VTDADVIGVLRDAAEALAIVADTGVFTDTRVAELRTLGRDCHDVATELARRLVEASTVS
jgi:hypothetical protein